MSESANSARQIATAFERSSSTFMCSIHTHYGCNEFADAGVLTSEQNIFQAETSLAVAMGNVPLGAIAICRALGGGWQIRVDSNFVTAARARTDWGRLLPPADEPQPPAPGLPSTADIGPTVRHPQW